MAVEEGAGRGLRWWIWIHGLLWRIANTHFDIRIFAYDGDEAVPVIKMQETDQKKNRRTCHAVTGNLWMERNSR